MSKEIGVGYKTLIAEFVDDASIEEAFSLYHYGVANYSAGSTPISANSIEGHFGNLDGKITTANNNITTLSTTVSTLFNQAVRNNPSTTSVNQITPENTSTVPLTIKAIASQTSNLQEWKDSADNVLASINIGGSLYLTNQATFNYASNIGQASSKIELKKSRGSLSIPTIISNGESLGKLQFFGYNGSSYNLAAEISGEIDGNPGINNMPGRIVFYTTTTSSYTERMRIDSTGRIKIPAGGILEAPISTNSKTSNYTLELSDAGRLIEMNSTSPTNLTLTIPTNTNVPFPIGTKIDVLRIGTGEATIVAASGVTINSEANKAKINAQWQAVSIVKRGTDSWVIIGALKA